ncbi:MAG: DUF3500 domain-containing protein [Bacteroidota bacterium]
MKKTTLTILVISVITILLLSFNAEQDNPVLDFLDSLNSEQQEKVNLSFDDMRRESWHFLPGARVPRPGIMLKDLNQEQRVKLNEMLQEYLSATGYVKTKKIIDLENVLAEIESRPEYRDPEKYSISIYGNPRKDSLWAWSFEGHHLSLNFTILNGKIAASPRFFGANPATIKAGPRKGERTLHEEEDLAYELLNGLSESQKQIAIFQNVSFLEIVTSNASEVAPLQPVGIKAEDLNPDQRNQLNGLIALYLSSLPEKIAKERQAKIQKEEFDEIRFGWAGGIEKSEAHYYRIQGKSFLIEFDNTQNDANHIHTVWRDFNGDFGRDLIKEHYHNSNHHKHD